MLKYIPFFVVLSFTKSLIAQPAITSFTPISGPVGTTVTINGINFSAIPAANIVFFGAVRATVSAATTTSLTVIVPTGATYQFITITTGNIIAYANKPFIVTFSCGGVINTGAFAPKVDLVNVIPYYVSTADIDGDGKPDLVVTGPGSDMVSVYRNTGTSGTISFAPYVDFSTGNRPLSVSIGDLDGDGRPDLAVANSISGTVSVLRNTSTSGTISFAPPVDFPTAQVPVSVSIGDLDGDGKPDLAIANQNSNSISVLRNIGTSGAIAFAPKVDFATGTYPLFVATGDLNGDGKPDLAVANGISGTVSVLRNTGISGMVSFAPNVDFPTGNGPASVSIGDLDGDGRPDLAVANENANTVSVLRNTGASGTISFAPNIDFPTGIAPASVSISDLDGDGKPDLAVSNDVSATVSIYRNTGTVGTITLAPKVDYTTGGASTSVSIADFDGDGKPDLAVANFVSNTVSVIKNIAIFSFSDRR